MKATPASLGDPSKDSPEELEGRYERVLSMTALAIGGVLNDLENAKTLQVQTGVQAGRTLSTSAGVQEIYHSVRALLKDPQFTRAFFKAKYARVRQSAYELISLISRNHVTLLSDDEVVMMIAPSVLASIGEKDHAIHASMWGALLSFASSFPSAWRAIDIPKVFLPRLWSHIRHISPVSADIAFPALLPLVSVLPNATVDKLSFFKSLLSSIWDSLASVAQEGARIAAAHAWQECFLFGMEQKSIEFDELFEVVFEPLALKAAIVNGDKLARDIVLAIAGTLVKSNSRFLGTFEKGMLRVVTKAVETGLVCNDPEKLHNVSLLLFSIGMEGGLEGQLLGAGTVEQCLALLLGHIFKDNEETLRVDAMVFATSLFKMLPPGSVPEPQPPSKREDECYVQVASSDPSQTELSMVSGLMEDLASKAHSDEYLGATCDLLVSLIARLQQPSELFFSVIDQLFKSPNFGLGGASCIVQSCIQYCKTTKKSTEHLRDWTSADLDKLCVQLCSKGRVEPIGASTMDFVSRVFIGDGKTVSLLTEQGQASLLRTLLGWIEISQPHSEDVQEWDGGDSDNIINILHLILQMVVANTLAKTSTLVALQMSVLSSLFHLLLREFIVLPNSFQVDEEGNVSEDEDMFVDKNEEESNVILHRNIARYVGFALLQTKLRL